MDIASMVNETLAESRGRKPSRQVLGMAEWSENAGMASANAYDRLSASKVGDFARMKAGSESKALDVASLLSIELILEYLEGRWRVGAGAAGFGKRFIVVPGKPAESPTLVILDPALADVSQSRRITEEVQLDPGELVEAYVRLRPAFRDDPELQAFAAELRSADVLELLAIARPEMVLSRRPRMAPLCAPAKFVEVTCGAETSSVGIYCRDAAGRTGVTACFHGTGPRGTVVHVSGVRATVDMASVVQDIAFVPLDPPFAIPQLYGLNGVRAARAPSEAERVKFEGAGTQRRVQTQVRSHDAGLLRRRPTVQLKVQTPADANHGDSGCALVDDDDRVVGFGFERTAVGEYPEFTDWIWADNALSTLGLVPI